MRAPQALSLPTGKVGVGKQTLPYPPWLCIPMACCQVSETLICVLVHEETLTHLFQRHSVWRWQLFPLSSCTCLSTIQNTVLLCQLVMDVVEELIHPNHQLLQRLCLFPQVMCSSSECAQSVLHISSLCCSLLHGIVSQLPCCP